MLGRLPPPAAAADGRLQVGDGGAQDVGHHARHDVAISIQTHGHALQHHHGNHEIHEAGIEAHAVPSAKQHAAAHERPCIELRELVLHGFALADQVGDAGDEARRIHHVLDPSAHALAELDEHARHLLLGPREEGLDHHGQVLAGLTGQVDDQAAVQDHDLDVAALPPSPEEVAWMHVAMDEAVLEHHRPEEIDEDLPGGHLLLRQLRRTGRQQLVDGLAFLEAHDQRVRCDPALEDLRDDDGAVDRGAGPEELAEGSEVLRLQPQIRLGLQEVRKLPQHQGAAQMVETQLFGEPRRQAQHLEIDVHGPADLRVHHLHRDPDAALELARCHLGVGS
mmetsp:Transcript_93074/g.262388  ORF Transcript_93074/g.262388 Transcript_93074/m.262388 type:complete len:336 (-) Transcript_93074:634-1641(-)